MENFHELLLTRHSIRKYTDEPIAAEDVKTILEAGLMAPSSKRSTAWNFIVVEDKESNPHCRVGTHHSCHSRYDSQRSMGRRRRHRSNLDAVASPRLRAGKLLDTTTQ